MGQFYVGDDAGNLRKTDAATGVFAGSPFPIALGSSVTDILIDDAGAVFAAYQAGTSDYRIAKYSGDGILAWESANLTSQANRITQDASGNTYAACDDGLIRKLDTAGTAVTTGGFPISPSEGTAFGIDVDGSGNIYVAFTGSYNVAAFDGSGTRLWTNSDSSNLPLNVLYNNSGGDSGSAAVYISGWDNPYISTTRYYNVRRLAAGTGIEDTAARLAVNTNVINDMAFSSGTLFVGSWDGTVKKVTVGPGASPVVVWTADVTDAVYEMDADADGNAYAGTSAGTVRAFWGRWFDGVVGG